MRDARPLPARRRCRAAARVARSERGGAKRPTEARGNAQRHTEAEATRLHLPLRGEAWAWRAISGAQPRRGPPQLRSGGRGGDGEVRAFSAATARPGSSSSALEKDEAAASSSPAASSTVPRASHTSPASGNVAVPRFAALSCQRQSVSTPERERAAARAAESLHGVGVVSHASGSVGAPRSPHRRLRAAGSPRRPPPLGTLHRSSIRRQRPRWPQPSLPRLCSPASLPWPPARVPRRQPACRGAAAERILFSIASGNATRWHHGTARYPIRHNRGPLCCACGQGFRKRPLRPPPPRDQHASLSYLP